MWPSYLSYDQADYHLEFEEIGFSVLQTLFCRHLTGEVSQEWQDDNTTVSRRERLMYLMNDIVPYLMHHNAEAEACDALMETEMLDDTEQYVDENSFQRVCLYLTR